MKILVKIDIASFQTFWDYSKLPIYLKDGIEAEEREAGSSLDSKLNSTLASDVRFQNT